MMRLLSIFSKLIGMLKGTTALPFLSELIMFTILSVVTGDIKKEESVLEWRKPRANFLLHVYFYSAQSIDDMATSVGNMAT